MWNTSAMIQVEGALLGSKTFLDETNCIYDLSNNLKDIWTIDTLGRNQVKKALTPILYGSGNTTEKLWLKQKIKYTKDQLKTMEKVLKKGKFVTANMMKSFIIDNCKPRPNMNLHIWNEHIEVEANRYRNLGDYVVVYHLWDSVTESTRTVRHTHTKRVPDMKQFKRYFVTALVHNLDSQVANAVCTDLNWVLPIHDAFIVHPSDAYRTKQRYADMITAIFNDRKTILANYFASIGIGAECQKEWNELMDTVDPVENFQCATTALK